MSQLGLQIPVEKALLISIRRSVYTIVASAEASSCLVCAPEMEINAKHVTGSEILITCHAKMKRHRPSLGLMPIVVVASTAKDMSTLRQCGRSMLVNSMHSTDTTTTLLSRLSQG
jgi:hypothetical protein